MAERRPLGFVRNEVLEQRVVGKGRARMDAVASAWAAGGVAQAQTVHSARSDTPNSDPPRIAPAPVPRRLPAHGSRTAKLVVVGTDALAVVVAMTAAAWVRQLAMQRPEAITPIIVTAAFSLPVWICVFARYKLYSAAAVTSVTAELGRILHSVAAGAVCMALVGVFLGATTSRVWLALTFFFALVTMLAGRALVRRAFRRARSRGQLKRRVIVIGANAEALALAQMLNANSELGYDVLGVLQRSATDGVVSPVPVLGEWSDALDIVHSVDVSGVIIATSAVDIAVANRLARELMELGYHVELTSGLVDISADRLIARPLGRRPVMYVEPVRLSGWRAAAKRGFDIALATSLLVLAAPVMAVAAILIKLDSRGPVFFSQLRVGRNGKLFRIWKLRTMVADAETRLEELRAKSDFDGPMFKMTEDPRVTAVGRLLRRTSIDEVPQLWNVLRGEMSVVGPRPALASELSAWSDEVLNRLRAKPGITGMWQVNGRSSSSFDDYVRHDLYYVDNWTLLTDLAIVAKTVPVVLSRRGAY